jgi:hypothetical protein
MKPLAILKNSSRSEKRNLAAIKKLAKRLNILTPSNFQKL